jgi:hypothetical protein
MDNQTTARQDVHRPSTFVAADYKYIREIDTDPGRDMDPASQVENAGYLRAMHELLREWSDKMSGDNASLSHCNVCGAWFRWATIWQHIPTGDYISTGEDCAYVIDRVQASVASADRRGLQKAAAEYGKLSRARAAFLELPRAAEALAYVDDQLASLAAARELWAVQNPQPDVVVDSYGEVHEGPNSRAQVDAYDSWRRKQERELPGNLFLGDMARAWKRYGHLTEKQLAAVLKGKDNAFGRGLATAARLAGAEQREAQRLASAWIGEPGKRFELTVTVRFEKLIEGDWGSSTLYGMVDEAGNTLRYFSTGSFNAEQGETLRIKATVKAHELYNGEHQTLLTRCVRVEQQALPV